MRKIDEKFSIDGDQILNPAGVPIPLDEPLFLLRGRDRLGVALLKVYLILSMIDKCTEYHLTGVKAAIQRFKDFRNTNPERMKQPGITGGK